MQTVVLVWYTHCSSGPNAHFNSGPTWTRVWQAKAVGWTVQVRVQQLHFPLPVIPHLCQQLLNQSSFHRQGTFSNVKDRQEYEEGALEAKITRQTTLAWTSQSCTPATWRPARADCAHTHTHLYADTTCIADTRACSVHLAGGRLWFRGMFTTPAWYRSDGSLAASAIKYISWGSNPRKRRVMYHGLNINVKAKFSRSTDNRSSKWFTVSRTLSFHQLEFVINQQLVFNIKSCWVDRGRELSREGSFLHRFQSRMHLQPSQRASNASSYCQHN